MRKTLKRPTGVSNPASPRRDVQRADDGAVLDVERELAVEQHLEAASGARRSRRRARRSRERRLRRGPGDAVAAESLPLLERDHGEPRLLSGLAVDRVGGQEREIGETLLERARRPPSDRSAVRAQAGRAAARPARCVPKRDRPRGDIAGEEPERGAALDEQADRLHTRDGGDGQHELRHAGREARGLRPGGEPLAEVDGRDPVRDRDGTERRSGGNRACDLALALRSRRAGEQRCDRLAERRAAAVDVDDLFALEERDLHRGRLRARAAWREDERDRGERCRHPEPSEEIPHPAEPIVR